MKITLRELRDIISEAVREEMIEEGFLDTLKRGVSTAALGVSIMFPSSVAANVPSGGSSYSAEEVPEEDCPFIIEDEDGKPHNFYLVTYARVDGKQYAAMESEEDELLYLFKVIITKDGVVIFESIENELEWEKVKNKVEEELESDKD